MPQIPKTGPLALHKVSDMIHHKGEASLFDIGVQLGMNPPIKMSELHGRYYSSDEVILQSSSSGSFFVGNPNGYCSEIEIVSSSPWEVIEKPYWITVSPMYSQRVNSAIRIKAQDNPYRKNRSGELIIENVEGKLLTLKIDQANKV